MQRKAPRNNEIKELENEENEKVGIGSDVRNWSIPEPAKRLIIDIRDQFKRNEINLHPEFQRDFIWPKNKQRELIKSVYQGVPLPMFYFATTDDNAIEVVDGQQRLTTILGFLGEKKLDKRLKQQIIKDVKITNDGEKVSLNEIKKKVGEGYIHCVNLPKASADFKYEIFRLLNQGAVILNAQEIRNCVFASEMKDFNKILRDTAKKLEKISNLKFKRMIGEELALRFFVINRYGYERDVTEVSNKFEKLKNDFDSETIKKMKAKFKLFEFALTKMFSDDIHNCFKVLKKDERQPQHGNNNWKQHFYSDKINQSLFHLLAYFIPQFDKRYYKSRDGKQVNKIKKGYLALLKNKEFVSVITGAGTNSTKNIKKAKELFKKFFVEKYLGDWTKKEKQAVSMAKKTTLLANVPYCYLCYGRLTGANLNSIQGDHIAPYSGGGETDKNNILLVHSKCNKEKSAQPLEVYFDSTKAKERRKRHLKNIREYLYKLKQWHKAHPMKDYKLLVKLANHP